MFILRILLTVLFVIIFSGLTTSKTIASESGGWKYTDPLKLPHSNPTSVLLPNNNVLVVGSDKHIEIYNNQNKVWTILSGSYKDLHYGSTSTLLQNGEVLITGLGNDSNSEDSQYGQLYNYMNSSWRKTNNLVNHKRINHTATLLNNGNLLVTGGGHDVYEPSHTTSEIYSLSTNSWTTSGPMENGRAYHTATLLDDGSVLVTGGGSIGREGFNPINTSEVFNQFTSIWTDMRYMNSARVGHSATKLPNGKVLVVGGYEKYGSNLYNPPLSSAEIYDPQANSWTKVSNMNNARAFHTATLIEGKVLIAGGIGDNQANRIYLNSVEIYDPETNKWTSKSAMNATRYVHTSLSISNKEILVVGGSNDKGSDQTGNSLKSAEVFSFDNEPNPTSAPIPTPPVGGSNLNVPLLKQGTAPFNDNNPSWEGDEFDHAGAGQFSCGTTMAECGCATSSIAMVFRYHGIEKLPDGTELTPGTLNNWLKNNNGYNRNLGVIWPVASSMVKKSKAQNPNFNFDALEYDTNTSYSAAVLSSDLNKGIPNILQVNAPGMHFVVAKGKAGNSFEINDPLFNRTSLSSYNNNAVSVRRYVPSNTDLSYITYIVDEDVDIVVKDANGEIVGESYLEYSPAQLINEPFNSETSAIKVFYYAKPDSGTYILELSSSSTNDFQLDEYIITEEGQVKTETYEGILKPNIISEFKLIYDKQTLENTVTEPIVTFEILKMHIHDLYLQKEIKNKLSYTTFKLQTEIAERASLFSKQSLGNKLAVLTLKTFQYELKRVRGKTITENAYQILYKDIEALIRILQGNQNVPTPTPGGGGS
jgi:hypothetical protein